MLDYQHLLDRAPTIVLIIVSLLCLLGISEEIYGKFLPATVRSNLWPIYGPSEHKKFIPIAILMLCVIFVYSTLRVQKDTLVQYNPGSSSEVFNFLKFGVVLPASIGFVIVYSKISNSLKSLRLYLTVLIFFAVGFALFGYVLNQGHDGLLFGDNGYFGHINIKNAIHGSPETLRKYQESMPALRFVFPVAWYWSTSLFYALVEIWGNVGVSILVFQLANSVSSKEEAGRIYPILGIIGNIGMICSGIVNDKVKLFEGIISYVVLACIIMIFVYIYIFYGADIQEAKSSDEGAKKKSKPKLSVSEGFKMILNTKYLLYIAVLVLAYNMSMNLVEVTWKSQLKAYCPTRGEYQSMSGNIHQWTGASTILLMFLSKGLISRCGWLFSAMITPIILLVTSALFFIFAVFGVYCPSMFLAYALDPLQASVIVGAIQNIATKSTKYSLFDPTREMLYIPLDNEQKTKGKAAVDVIGGRLGKSGGGIIQMIMLSVLGIFMSNVTQMTIAPFIGIFVVLIMFAWIWAVRRLSVEYNQYSSKSENKK